MRMWQKAIAAVAAGVAAFGVLAEEAKTKVLFLAGPPSHALGEHEHIAGCKLLAKCLEEGMPNIETQVHEGRLPKEIDPALFEGVATVVVYCDGGPGHILNPHVEFFDGLMKKGVGLVCIHYAVETTKGKYGDKFLEWLGGYFEPHWSVNPHWDANYEEIPAHAITRGIPPFGQNDEWYYHMRFAKDMGGVTPILTTLPPESTLTRPDGPHSGNPHVREAIKKGEKQHMAWAFERPDGGRAFGFTGGHFHRNWQEDPFRKLMLNAITWTAKVEVPEDGVNSATPTDEEMQANLKDK
jgi:hypothetical protein